MGIVIVGAGGAGVSAIEAIRSVNRDAEIKLVARETSSYSLFSLPFYLAKKIDRSRLERLDNRFYQRMNVETLLGNFVTAVKPEEKSISLDNGESVEYDSLLIATGSSPIIPRIKGIHREGVFTLGSLQDCERISSWVDRGARRCVVIGAGFVGLESAVALKVRGVEVTVIEALDRVLPRMLDPDTAEIVREILVENDVSLLLGAQVEEVLGKGEDVEAVRTRDSKIDCDMVIVAVGVKPNIELVTGTKIQTNVGILVDSAMRTSDKAIYAAGDVAESFDRITGKRVINAIWPNAIIQGRIAGHNMVGVHREYEGSDSINLINIFDVPILAIGLTSSELGECETLTRRSGKIFRKLLIRGNSVLGYQSVGELRNAGLILTAIRKNLDISGVKRDILKARFAYPLLKP